MRSPKQQCRSIVDELKGDIQGLMVFECMAGCLDAEGPKSQEILSVYNLSIWTS